MRGPRAQLSSVLCACANSPQREEWSHKLVSLLVMEDASMQPPAVTPTRPGGALPAELRSRDYDIEKGTPGSVEIDEEPEKVRPAQPARPDPATNTPPPPKTPTIHRLQP